MFNVEEVWYVRCFLSTCIYIKDGITKSVFCKEQTTDIPFAGGASIFLGTGTGTFSLGTAFLWTSGTLEKWVRWEGRWERMLRSNICNCVLYHNVFYSVNTNSTTFHHTGWNLTQPFITGSKHYTRQHV